MVDKKGSYAVVGADAVSAKIFAVQLSKQTGLPIIDLQEFRFLSVDDFEQLIAINSDSLKKQIREYDRAVKRGLPQEELDRMKKAITGRQSKIDRYKFLEDLKIKYRIPSVHDLGYNSDVARAMGKLGGIHAENMYLKQFDNMLVASIMKNLEGKYIFQFPQEQAACLDREFADVSYKMVKDGGKKSSLYFSAIRHESLTHWEETKKHFEGFGEVIHVGVQLPQCVNMDYSTPFINSGCYEEIATTTVEQGKLFSQVETAGKSTDVSVNDTYLDSLYVKMGIPTQTSSESVKKPEFSINKV